MTSTKFDITIKECIIQLAENDLSKIISSGDFGKRLEVKNNDEFVKLSFTMPQTKYKYHDCYVPSFRAVNGIVSDRISKMIDAGNISGAIDALGGKHTDNIVELVKKNKLIEFEKEI